MALTLIILSVTVILMATGKIRSDLIAFGALLCMMLFSLLTPQEGLSGFSSSVIFVMVGMFIIGGAIVRTGLASIISNKILTVAGKNTNILFMLVMILTAIIGSLVSNTGTVAIIMPIVVSLSLTIDESPSRFLMPLAFMSSIGGMFTLLGNSSNMVVSDVYVKAGFPPLTLFSFFPVGVVCFLFGVLVLAPVTSRYLSRRKNAKVEPDSNVFSMRKLAEKYQIVQNMHYLEVTKDSDIIDKRLVDLHLPEVFGVVVADIIRPRKRHGQSLFTAQRPSHYFPDANTVLRLGDVLQVVGSVMGVKTMAADTGLHMVASDTISTDDSDEYSAIGICELIIMSSSRLVKRTVAESGLRNQFGITVLGIQRGSQYIIEEIKDLAIQSGDSLLVQGSWENLARLEDFSNNWVVVGRPKDQAGAGQQREKIPLVIAVVVAMLLVTAFNILPIVVAVLVAALALIIGGCFKNMDDVYSTMGWETLVMMACLLPMSIAMEHAGILDIIAKHMVRFGGDYGPHITLAVIYAISSLLNIVISTTPVTLLIAPVAVQVAESLQCSPLPFLVAVATAASMCFASPFSTPSNALVMSAGRYTFTDYLKVGVPMQILMGVVVVAVLPYIYPFFPAA